MNRINIAIIFGGCSEEHAISIKSAQEVAKNLDPEKYQPFYIGITKAGIWKLCDRLDTDWENGNCYPAILSPDRSVHGLLIQEQNQFKTIRLDIIFPVLHGKLGEDGAIQGLFELSGIPYIGCDIQSSAICMDKSLAYIVTSNAGIATPHFLTTYANGQIDTGNLTYPLFVKPARSGSSFGVSKVCRQEELAYAINTAQQYDNKILIEEAIIGSEVGCAVLGNDNDLIVGEVDQIRLSHGFFRIHQEKNPECGSENSTVVVPADISAEARIRVQKTAKAVYHALGCKGLARVDLFLQEDGQVVLNEVNTLPGMTSYSRYPRMMAAAGIRLSQVIDRIVALAMKG